MVADAPAREYTTGDVVVEWRPSLCFQSHNCVAALPQVFDPERRPWVTIDAASGEEIEQAVATCPSGALRTRRVAAVAVESVVAETTAAETTVTALRNGPFLVTGHLRILDADGAVVSETEKAALCRCGQSANKPFCDGTHAKVGFVG